MNHLLEQEIDEAHLEYLDDLRQSGTVNMFGAASYLSDEFMLSKQEARNIVSYWMSTFSERHGIKS